MDKIFFTKFEVVKTKRHKRNNLLTIRLSDSKDGEASYSWAPRWADVRQLLVESIAVEKKNNPESENNKQLLEFENLFKELLELDLGEDDMEAHQ